MMELTVPAGNIAGMVFSLLVAWGIPIALCIVIRRKLKADMISFFLGCGTFFLFAMFLEQLLHAVVLLRLGDISEALKNSVWLYAVYGGLAAGIFEETGRFLCMKFFMKKSLTKQNAVMYGAGHGGFEAVLILGMASVNNLISSALINSGAFVSALAEGADSQQAIEAVTPLATLPAWQFFLGGFERIFAMALHIGLSLLIYQAVENRKKWYLYPLAILFHALLNAIIVIIANHGSLVFAEAATLAGTALVCAVAWKTAWNRQNQ